LRNQFLSKCMCLFIKESDNCDLSLNFNQNSTLSTDVCLFTHFSSSSSTTSEKVKTYVANSMKHTHFVRSRMMIISL
jgi:hypothetical protein